jgi:hypothetical protein
MKSAVSVTSQDVITAFIQQVILQYHAYADLYRRAEQRESVAVPVLVQPLDLDLQPLGGPFEAVTRDVSPSGIGLFVSRSIEVPSWMTVTIRTPETLRELRLIAHVEHCTPCGGMYIVGCRFADVMPEESSPAAILS